MPEDEKNHLDTELPQTDPLSILAGAFISASDGQKSVLDLFEETAVRKVAALPGVQSEKAKMLGIDIRAYRHLLDKYNLRNGQRGRGASSTLQTLEAAAN